MTSRQREQRERALQRNQCICPVCKGSIYQYGTPQYAHKIANTETFRKKYGSFFIDHTLNGEMVCSLECNQVMNIGYNKGKVLSLLSDILIYEMERFNGNTSNS